MTIYTTEQALNPEEKKEIHGDYLDVEIQMSDEKKALTSDWGTLEEDYTVYNDTTIPVVSASRLAAIRRQRKIRRRNMWLLPLLLLGMIVGITMCIFGSMQLWSGMYYSAEDDYTGRCGVGIVDMSKYNDTDRAEALRSAQEDKDVKNRVDYVEDIDILGPVETMTVPKQGNSAGAVIRHDFDTNMTAIRDELQKVCYFVPFLQEFFTDMIPSPANFTLYLKRIEIDGSTPVVFEQDRYFETVSEVDDMSDYGIPLSEICQGTRAMSTRPASDKTTTKLPPTTTREVLPTTAPEHTTDLFLQTWHPDLYRMYPGGDAMYNYHIFDQYNYEYYSDY